MTSCALDSNINSCKFIVVAFSHKKKKERELSTLKIIIIIMHIGKLGE